MKQQVLRVNSSTPILMIILNAVVLISTLMAAPTSWAAGPGRGGADGGGGNSQPAQPLSRAELDSAIRRSRYFLERILNYQELLSQDSHFFELVRKESGTKAGRLLQDPNLLAAYKKGF